MKHIIIVISLLFTFTLDAQIILEATSSDGSGYPAVLAAGLDIENPDCEHTTFGPHVTQVQDAILEKNVFAFHSHIEEDNDRCQVFDRVRMEIKGGPNTNQESQHLLGTESFYRWKFMIPEDFQGSSSFCHLFQNKIKGGEDSSFPVITITARTSKLEVIHNGGETGEDLGKVVNVDLEPFLGTWVEAYVYQLHSETGTIKLTLKNLLTGEVLVSYENDNIDLWRDGAEYSRPKWGIYRRKADGLKDETIRFADFCISEVSAELCPADETEFIDNQPPTSPANLTAMDVEIDNLTLAWEASEDNFGVSEYIIFQDGDSIWSGSDLNYKVSDLLGGTTYEFFVKSSDFSGNRSESSNLVSVITDPADALPEQPSNPSPGDMGVNVARNVTLKWDEGKNTDSTFVYFGSEDALKLLSRQTSNTYALELDYDSTYFWQIGHKNENGITLGPTWSFTTSSEGNTEPWVVYRGNARPDLENNLFLPRDIPEEPEIDHVLADPLAPSNNIYQYLEESDEKFRWRYEFPETDTAFTVVARIKAFPEAKNVGYFEIRQHGVREKLRINHSTFKLEKSSPIVEEEYDFNFDDDFHILRLTMKEGVMTVYLDESEEPFVTGFSETIDAGSNFEFGKSGGTPTGSFIDWLVILPNLLAPPGSGPDLPPDLILNNNVNSTEEHLMNALKFYPNPSSGIFYYESKIDAEIKAHIYSAQGLIVKSFNVQKRGTFDLSSFPNGLYYVFLTSQGNQYEVQKIHLLK